MVNYVAVAVFLLVYALIVSRKFTPLNVEPWMAMLIGAVLMVGSQVTGIADAYSSINMNVIVFLVGMFFVVGALDASGFLRYLAFKLILLARTPDRLLLYVIIFTSLSSAFFVNDAMVLVMTPIAVTVCRLLHVRSTPFLLAVAFSSNIGSALTPIGNPQNVLIKIVSSVGIVSFIVYMALPVAVGTIIQYYFLKSFFRKQLVSISNKLDEAIHPEEAIHDRSLMIKSVAIAGLVIIGFFLSDFLQVGLSFFAILGGAMILLLHNRRVEILHKVDWTIIIFFAGMFVVMDGFAKSGLLSTAVDAFSPLFFSNSLFTSILSIHLVSTVISQFTSNVPCVALLIPVFIHAGAKPIHWLALASGSTLGGNATLLGAAANVIVLETAETRGETFTFAEFAKAGIILTIITVLVASILLTAIKLFLF